MRKILIVEDDILIAEIERDYLEIEDFEVTICQDGQEGLKLALDNEYDLILLDVMLRKHEAAMATLFLTWRSMDRSLELSPNT